MLGYRDEREYVGKAAARSDDAANWVPTRITGLLLVAVSALKGTAGRAWWAFRTQHQPAVRTQQDAGHRDDGRELSACSCRSRAPTRWDGRTRPLTADVIDDAAWMVWAAGGATVALAAGPGRGAHLGGALHERRAGRLSCGPCAASVHGAVDPSALRAEGVDPGAIVDFSSNQSPLGAAPGVAAAVAGAVRRRLPGSARRGALRAPGRPSRREAGAGRLRQRQHRADPAGRAAGAGARRRGSRAGAGVRRVRGGHGPRRRAARVRAPGARRGRGGLLLRRARPPRGTARAAPAPLLALLAQQPDRGGAARGSDRRPGRRAPGHALRARRGLLRPAARAAVGARVAGSGQPHRAPLDDQVLGPRRPAPRARGRRAGPGRGAARRGASLERQRLRPGRGSRGARRPRRTTNGRSRCSSPSATASPPACGELGWTTEPTTAGFFLIRAGDAPELRRALLERGLLVRDCTSFGLPAHVRVSPRHPGQNDLLLEAFAALAPPEAAR